MLLAHPVTESLGLGVAPAVVALGVACALWAAVVVLRRTAPRTAHGPAVGGVVGEPVGGDQLRPVEVVGRVVGGGLLLLAVVAGRAGAPSQLETITTALVVGAGWPLLLLTSLVWDVWGWLSPFDGIARLLDGVAGGGRRAEVPDVALDGVAVAGAALVTWWLTAYQPGLEPRVLGLAVGLYALVTWAGCLAVGRARWLAHAEVFTVLFSIVATARRRGSITPSTGHVVTLAVLLGGLAAAELRFSRWFITDVARLGLLPFSEPATVAGYVLAVGLGLLTIGVALRWGVRLRSADRVLVVLPFLVVGLGLSAAVERDRLWVSMQVLWSRLSDPLGTGMDLLGTADTVIRPWPYGVVARLVLQLTLLLLPTVVGLWAALRPAEDPRRPQERGLRTQHDRRTEPAVVLVTVWVVIGVLSAASL